MRRPTPTSAAPPKNFRGALPTHVDGSPRSRVHPPGRQCLFVRVFIAHLSRGSGSSRGGLRSSWVVLFPQLMRSPLLSSGGLRPGGSARRPPTSTVPLGQEFARRKAKDLAVESELRPRTGDVHNLRNPDVDRKHRSHYRSYAQPAAAEIHL